MSVTNNNQVCGASKAACTTTKANCVSTCSDGACVLSGASGYSYSTTTDSCVATTSDVNNCGAPGYVCYAPANGKAACQQSTCSYTCNSGYTQSGLSCKSLTASAATVNKKKRGPVEAFFCPAGEEACPIVGSQSLAQALAASKSKQGTLKFDSVKSGYECLDTQSTLESCGGCASTGEGVDCSKLPHASSMGCSESLSSVYLAFFLLMHCTDEGKCTIFKCLPGFVANAKGTKCLRASHRHHNATSQKMHGRAVHDHSTF